MFIFILGIGPIYGEFRIWVSNLFFSFILFIESLSHLVLVVLFYVYFAFNCYLSLNVILLSLIVSLN